MNECETKDRGGKKVYLCIVCDVYNVSGVFVKTFIITSK